MKLHKPYFRFFPPDPATVKLISFGDTAISSMLSLFRNPRSLPTRHQILQNTSRWKKYATLQSQSPSVPPERPLLRDKTGPLKLLVPSESKSNEVGIQLLPAYIREQLFGDTESTATSEELVDLSKKHLEMHGLLGKAGEPSKPISFELPPLQGKTLDEHFYKLGMEASQPYLSFANDFAKIDLPPRPQNWITTEPGWTKYNPDGTLEKVANPESEEMLVFDVEVLYKQSPFAIMACAASPTAWYAWLSPWLLGSDENDRHLISLGDSSRPRIVVGHNIGYDRARIKEEYDIKQTKTSFLDTMSLHVAVNGMCSRQRPTWMRHAKNKILREKMAADSRTLQLTSMIQDDQITEENEELWVGRSSINSLRDVAKFHCDVVIDKGIRDEFGKLDREGVCSRLGDLMDYCAVDVEIAHKVYKKTLPLFLNTCPHPVSFAALRHISSVVLPVNKAWQTYIDNAEKIYSNYHENIQKSLEDLALKALEGKDQPEEFNNDPWLRQLDWSVQAIRMVKGKKKGDPERPALRQKLPGYPKWYKNLFPKANGPINLSVRSRIAPLLLRMTWEGHPLVWSDIHGWTFCVPLEDVSRFSDSPVVRVSMEDEKNPALKDDKDNAYFKIPHKDGAENRCTTPLAKGYLQYFESGMLDSEFPLAKTALEMNAACSYWISARERIKSQMVVYASDTKTNLGLTFTKNDVEPGMILPLMICMGTITRRAVESTWLTASNAKKNRVGSELKAMVKAPPGYVFVGADVDSEELWIASLVGDAQFKIHGGNAVGFMTLEGSKAKGTDLHSKTSSILGISRNQAKIFNYGRIYGAGVRFATTLLRQFCPSMPNYRAANIAQTLYLETKGVRTRALKRPFWRGGTESFVFNKLEEFAEQDYPQTPVLGAGITEALQKRNINTGAFLTSRINWAIQSSGVDYLHLLIVSMDYLIRTYGLDARLAITVHDEIRYLVKDDHRYRTALALQIANIWTRAMFSQQMGIEDLPQSCAWFSAVDIDSVLRKEVDLDCVTPSHPDPIPAGESLTIEELLSKDELLVRLDPDDGKHVDVSDIEYKPRTPVMETLGRDDQSLKQKTLWLRAQIAKDENEYKNTMKEYAAETALSKPKIVKQPKGLLSMDRITAKTVKTRPSPVMRESVVTEGLHLIGPPPDYVGYHGKTQNRLPTRTSPAAPISNRQSFQAYPPGWPKDWEAPRSSTPRYSTHKLKS
jgi:DNA polymerase gamma 1